MRFLKLYRLVAVPPQRATFWPLSALKAGSPPLSPQRPGLMGCRSAVTSTDSADPVAAERGGAVRVTATSDVTRPAVVTPRRFRHRRPAVTDASIVCLDILRQHGGVAATFTGSRYDTWKPAHHERRELVLPLANDRGAHSFVAQRGKPLLPCGSARPDPRPAESCGSAPAAASSQLSSERNSTMREPSFSTAGCLMIEWWPASIRPSSRDDRVVGPQSVFVIRPPSSESPAQVT